MSCEIRGIMGRGGGVKGTPRNCCVNNSGGAGGAVGRRWSWGGGSLGFGVVKL